ncbi:MAG TPA: twin-arginine translocation signal domain-containing protein, partial [Tepidisphaeraceae bacterium]|nr:twin-arginine translocation signal domain-containing protein [Tepidisphaeraceae bacterium]
MPRRMTRRTFVKATSAAVGAALFVPASAFGANEKLSVACVGVGGRGGEDMDGVSRENVLAICDCDERTLKKAGAKAEIAKARQFTDFRVML